MTKKERKRRKRIRLKNKKLIKMYPWLIPRNVWTGNIIGNYDYSWHELDALGDGWWEAFGLALCRDIQEELEKYHYVNDFRIQEVKEKFGEMRLYCSAPGKVLSIIDKYTYVSRHVCYGCGKPDAPITDSGWILPLCKECFEKQRWFKNSSKTYEDFVICCGDNELDDTTSSKKSSKNTNEIPVSYDIKHYSEDKGDWIETVNVEDIVNEIRRNWKKREHKRERDRIRRIRRSNG